MSFTGTPVIEQVSDRLIRITGLSIPTSDTGIIGLASASGLPTPDVLLPAAFQVAAHSYAGIPVPLTGCVEVRVYPEGSDPGAFTNLPVSIQKGGTTLPTFRITLVNTNTGEPTQTLEIWVELHTGLVTQPASLTS